MQQSGIVFEGYEYIDPTLSAYVGEEVMIRYDPIDLAEIRVFFQDRFVCRAICPELSGQTVSLKEIVAARQARRRQVRGELVEREVLVKRYMKTTGEAAGKVEEKPEEGEGAHPLWSQFVKTKEYRRFVEFCEVCRASRYIGLCYGAAGVGETESSWEYAQWKKIESLLSWHGVVQPRLSADNPRPRAALYTPPATVTARQIEKDIVLLRWSLRVIGEAASSVPETVERVEGVVRPGQVDLLLVDEADRLKPLALEVLRDLYDRNPMGLILVGMPGLEKRLARYPQLYSRIGFVHQYRTLDREEQQKIIEQQVRSFGVEGGGDRKIEKDAVAQMIRMTGGNFRQMERLLSQMKRIIEINPEVEVVSKVVEAAWEQLVFGKGF